MPRDVRTIANRVGRFVLDALAPQRCVSCGKIGSVVCADCWTKVKRHPQISSGPAPLEAIYSCVGYEEPIVKQLIHDLKYNSLKDAAYPLAELLTEVLKPMLQPNDILVPIPLHRKRKSVRGFNQSELLANTVGEILTIPVQNLVSRNRNTKPQVECDAHERRTNLHEAFTATATTSKRIIIVDDVTTTGTTFMEAAKAIRKVTDAPIIGLAVARGG